MKKNVSILFCLFFASNLFSQITFVRHYPTSSFSQKGNSIVVNKKGNYIITGERGFGSNKLDDFLITEINELGDTVWSKSYGTDSLEHARQIIQTNDGGYASIGYKYWHSSSYRKIYFLKTDSVGNEIWSKQIDNSGYLSASSLTELNTGEYLIGGITNQNSNGLLDFYLVKTDQFGDTLWAKRIGGNKNEVLNSLQKTSDGGFVLGGYSESFTNGDGDFYIVKTNGNGDTLWTNHFGGALKEECLSIKQTSDGGYIMTGYSQSYGLSFDNIYVVKTNSLGDSVWTKHFGYANRDTWGNDIIETSDGGFAITGLISGIKTPSGPIKGDKAYFLKLDAFGTLQMENEFTIDPTHTSYNSSRGNSLVETPGGGFAITGSWFNGSSFELIIIKTDNKGTIGLTEQDLSASFIFYPNPFSQSATLKFENQEHEEHELKIFDSRGNLVREVQHIITSKVKIEKNNLSNGLYYFQLLTAKKVKASGKIIIN